MDYYEHTVFEFSTQDVQGNQTLALGGGGRYDGLAETMGHNRSVPSVGLGLGADRTIEVAKKDAFSDIQTDKKFFMISLDTAGFKKSVALSRILSSAGLSVLLHASDNKIGKQFEKAETLGYTYVLLLGENELLRNIILLKNLRTREQFEINIETIVDELQKI